MEFLYSKFGSTIVNLSGVLLSVVSLALAYYYERRKKSRPVTWADVERAVSVIADKITKAKFKPTLIVTPGTQGAIISGLLARELKLTLPIFVGITISPHSMESPPTVPGFSFSMTSNWCVGLPEAVLKGSDRKVLFVDDFVMSGDSLARIQDRFRQSGISEDDFRSAAVIVSEVAVRTKKAPDFFWHVRKSTQFPFPWGKAE